MGTPLVHPLSRLLFLALVGCGTTWKAGDLDGDGLSPAEGDCWDAAEGPAGTGLSGDQIKPGADDSPFDGVDADCAGNDDYDLDGDGWVALEEHMGKATFGVPGSGNHLGFGDCKNEANTIETGLNGLESLAHSAIHPGAADTWYDGIDADCGGNDDLDQDGDGESAAGYLDIDGVEGTDCADTDDTIFAGAVELCDGIDNDCDAAVDTEDDDLDPTSWDTYYQDLDGDTFGDDATEQPSCEPIADWVTTGGDCDDANFATNPDATEICNEGVDDDCDDLVDDADDSISEASASAWYPDVDGDTYGDGLAGFLACEAPGDGFVSNPSDCDDGAAGINPEATEVCDGADNDCDTDIDDTDATLDLATRSTFFADADADTFGDPTADIQACAAPAGYVVDASDCNDGNAAVNPDAVEICNSGVDDDCNLSADDADAGTLTSTKTTYYRDLDSDTYGSSTSLQRCAAPAGYVTTAGDCNDGNAAINPGEIEICNSGTDDDCDSLADDADSSVSYDASDRWYADADGDGYGLSASFTDACIQPASTSATAGDCDDTSSAISPADLEICNGGVDDDCDGLADDADTSTTLASKPRWYLDGDSDGYGAGSASRSCLAPAGRVSSSTDCNDGNSAVNPGATEICNGGVDDDCDSTADDADGSVDRSTTGTNWYTDADSDGFGDETALAQRLCANPGGSVANNTDCDDDENTVNPGEDEVCNDGFDNDCDGTLGTTASTDTCELDAGAAATVGDIRLTDTVTNTYFGYTVVMADLTGDLVDDLLISAPNYTLTTGPSATRNFRGRAYLIEGDAGWVPGATSLDLAVESTTIHLFQGNEAIARFASSMAVGDVDGDGNPEAWFGAPGQGSVSNTPADRGAVFLFEAPYAETGSTADEPTTAFREGAGASDFYGSSIAADGASNGDDFTDMLIGATECGTTLLGISATGSNGYVHHLRGQANLTTLGAAAPTTTWTGALTDGCAGFTVTWADLDADGIDEAIIAEVNTSSSSIHGRVYAADASMTGTISLADERWLEDVNAGDFLGERIAVGDADGDGTEDLLLSERRDDAGGTNAGAVFLVLGDAFPATSGTPEAIADSTFQGDAAQDFLGLGLSFAGDVDGDGETDMVVGAYQSDAGGTTDSGSAWLVYGPLDGRGAIDVSATTRNTRWTGAADPLGTGYGAAAGGDLNADGTPDIVVTHAGGSSSQAHAISIFLGLGY